MENRKHRTRRGLLILGVSILVGVMMGCLVGCGQEVQSKTFSEQGMSITLTNEFKEFDAGEFTVGYESKNVAVIALKEEFSLMEGFEDYTLEEYGNLVLKNNEMDFCELNTAEGLTYFEYLYTDPESEEDYQYFSCVYKAEDSFWLIHFVTLADSLGVYADQMLTWAKSVEFTS